MLRFLLFGLLASGLVVAGFLTFLYVIQRRFLFFPTHRDVGAVGGAGFRPWIGAGGTFLGYVKAGPSAKETAKRTILFFHGNGGEALDRSWIEEVFPDSESFVLCLAEYPGYGPKPGEPTEESLVISGEEAFDRAVNEWKLPVIVLGESLGSAVAVHVASKRPAERLALISPLSSVLDVAKIHYGFLPLSILLRDKFESSKWIASVKAPVQAIHGTMDEVVPLASGKALIQAVQSSKKMTEIPGYGHNNISSAVTDSPFAEDFRKFLRGE